MKNLYGYGLAILLFGTLWGLSEAALGGWLYSAKVSGASVVLSVIAVCILTVARKYLPITGGSTLIAAVAMLFKFLNTPFFACHLLAIVLLGVAYDAVFSAYGKFAKSRKTEVRLWTPGRALCAAAATYLGYLLFALTITYVFRYHYWADAGFEKIMGYVGLSGSIAAGCNAILAPLCFSLAHVLRKKTAALPPISARWAVGGLSAVTAAIWILAATFHLF